MIWHLLIASVFGGEARFKLAKKLKAVPGMGNKVALLHDPFITTQAQEWSGPIKFNTAPKTKKNTNLFHVQNVRKFN